MATVTYCSSKMGRKEKRSKCQEDAISPSKLTPEQVSLVISEGNFSSKRFCFEKDKGPSIKLVFMLEKRKDGLWVVISLENKLKEKKIFIEQFKLEVVTAKKGLHQILCEQRKFKVCVETAKESLSSFKFREIHFENEIHIQYFKYCHTNCSFFYFKVLFGNQKNGSC